MATPNINFRSLTPFRSQIYTQVSIRQLKEVHTRTHPARLTAAVQDNPELAAELAEEEAELADEDEAS